jgi:Protein of unknown function (DUF2786)
MTTKRDDLLSKIRALLAKTTESGCTEEEMMTAFAKANAMIAAYEVTEDELALTKDERAILRQEPPGTKDEHLIKWELLGAVAHFCGCKGWRRNRAKGGGIVFCGLPAEAQHATWLLDFLANFVKEEIVNYLRMPRPAIRTAALPFVALCSGAPTVLVGGFTN